MGTAPQTPVRERQGWAVGPGAPLWSHSVVTHFCLSDFRIHGVVGFEDFLCLLLGARGGERFGSGAWNAPPRPSAQLRLRPLRCSQAQLLPTLEEVLSRHLCRLEELVDGHRELQGEGLGGTPVPGRAGRGQGGSIRPRPPSRRPWPLGRAPPDSPEAHGQERGRQEVPQTLDVEHLLHLRPAVHLRGHALGLHRQLCRPGVKEARKRRRPPAVLATNS